MDQTQKSQESGHQDPIVIDISAPHFTLGGRVSAVAASANLVYMGTVAGDIRVIGRINGEDQDKRWAWEHRPIEGVMFDHEGKLVYATEMNLAILDRNFNDKIKEYRSVDPLRNLRLILALSHITGRRMRPSLDHSKVAWWGNRSSLSIIDLEKLQVKEHPMPISSDKSTLLVTYDIFPITQLLVYILSEGGQHKMVHSYDMRTNESLGVWLYENPLCKNKFLIQSTTMVSLAEAWLYMRNPR
jgi:hypothetical protein